MSVLLLFTLLVFNTSIAFLEPLKILLTKIFVCGHMYIRGSSDSLCGVEGGRLELLILYLPDGYQLWPLVNFPP